MNVPKLRFKDEDGREFPEWEVEQLSALVKVYDGTHMTPDYQDQGIPFYSVEHVTNNNFSETKFIAREIFEKENKRVKLEKGDILMTRIGDIGTPKYIDWDVEASFYVSLALLKQSKKINSLYLSHYIRTNLFQNELHQRTIHVAFPKKINLGEISNCLVNCPSLTEQTKIANFLTAIDAKISQLTQKCDLLKQYKKGVMQQIFSQKLRFKDDDGREFPEWEEMKLGNVGRVSMCKRILKEQTKPVGDVPFYKIGTFGKQTDAYISNEIYESYKTKFSFPKKGDILISAAGTIGRAVVYDGSPAYFQDSNIVWIDNNEELVTNSFLYFIYANVKWNTENTTIARLYNENLRSLSILVPSLPEQIKIANFLTAIDDKITQAQTQLDAVKLYKKGLLQQLFV